MKNKLKICLIGCGRAGMIHARSYAGNVRNAELIAMCDPMPANLEAAQKEIEVPCLYTDYREALKNPEIDALGVHCGYAGFAPRCFCSKWKMVPKVLAIVDEKAYMIDCELPTGDMVLAKINPSFDKITVIPGQLEKYVQFPGTDARNASLLHYSKGGKVMEELPSHHQMIITGRQQAAISQIARVFGWACEIIS